MKMQGAPLTLAVLLPLAAFVPAQDTVNSFEKRHTFDGPGIYADMGRSVAGAGDVNRDGYDDLIVGAPSASPGGMYAAGSCFVYSGKDGNLLWQFDGPAARTRLGTSVSGAGDVDDDGYPDVIVGLPPKAHVYSGSDGSQLWELSILQGGSLGWSVSGAGDANGDGNDDVIVGAPSVRVGADEDAGSAIVYSGSGDGGPVRHPVSGSRFPRKE